MSAKYLIRLDDICPTMNWGNFIKLRKIFEENNIKPIIGIIPGNKDEQLNIENENEDFWNILKELKNNNWIVAQHGYQHLYVNGNGGILNINKKSELSGLSYRAQLEKILMGKEILEKNLETKIEWWMAPAHSFDKNTCKVLKELNFKYITDGIALFPFEKFGLTWVPQQLWKPRKKLFGLWTICIHPNSVTNEFLNNLDKFIKENKEKFKVDSFCPNFCLLNNIYFVWWKFQYLIYKLFIK